MTKSTKSKKQLAQAIEGSDGTPGASFHRKVATIYLLPNDRGYELATHIRWGSNQGYLEEHGRHERTYRASRLDTLLRVGIEESRDDPDMNDPELYQAIRTAVFEAQDQEAEGHEPLTMETADCPPA